MLTYTGKDKKILRDKKIFRRKKFLVEKKIQKKKFHREKNWWEKISGGKKFPIRNFLVLLNPLKEEEGQNKKQRQTVRGPSQRIGLHV